MAPPRSKGAALFYCTSRRELTERERESCLLIFCRLRSVSVVVSGQLKCSTWSLTTCIPKAAIVQVKRRRQRQLIAGLAIAAAFLNGMDDGRELHSVNQTMSRIAIGSSELSIRGDTINHSRY